MSPAVHQALFQGWEVTTQQVLERIGAPAVLAEQRRILIKPNLVNGSPPPVTFPVEAAAALVNAVRRWSRGEVVIGEGTGAAGRNTGEIFRRHGYDRLARDLGVRLVDLNEAPLVRLRDPACEVFPEMWLPEVVLESFVISAAVLKAHSLAGVTLTLKNMMGCAPPAHFQRGGSWKKAAFHRRMHRSVYELNRYRKPDLGFLDATMGLREHHLGGPACEPPVDRVVAGLDPVAVDAAGAALLGCDWREVEHLRLAHGVLGDGAMPEAGFRSAG